MIWRRWGEQTIFPGSVDPRAKMKMALGQGPVPVTSSFCVVAKNCRASKSSGATWISRAAGAGAGTGTGTGAAAASKLNSATTKAKEYFISTWREGDGWIAITRKELLQLDGSQAVFMARSKAMDSFFEILLCLQKTWHGSFLPSGTLDIFPTTASLSVTQVPHDVTERKSLAHTGAE